MKGKRILIVIAVAAIVAGSLTACSDNKNEKETTKAVNNTVTVSTVANEDTSSTETTAKEGTTAKTETIASTTKKADATTKKANTANKTYNTTKKTVATTKKTTTTKKATTTQKATTTKKTTTVKNVTPSEICSQANAYIRSKGKNVDTSLRPNASSWRGQITNRQDHMNEGKSLKLCKEYVDLAISEGAVDLYCYYDGSAFYILYF